MSERDFRHFLLDIWLEIGHIEEFSRALVCEQMTADRKSMYAIVRCLEIIGEAAKKIPKDIRSDYPEIPWKSMAGMRDKLIHEYFGIDHEILWETVKYRIPELKKEFSVLVRDYNLCPEIG